MALFKTHRRPVFEKRGNIGIYGKNRLYAQGAGSAGLGASHKRNKKDVTSFEDVLLHAAARRFALPQDKSQVVDFHDSFRYFRVLFEAFGARPSRPTPSFSPEASSILDAIAKLSTGIRQHREEVRFR